MADPTVDELTKQLTRLAGELDRRAAGYRKRESYYDGKCPLPAAIVRARVTKAYRMLMGLAEAPWGALVVDSVQDRLEVSGIRSDDAGTDDAVWGWWQENMMDAESKLAHNSALIAGRAFALVWAETPGEPEIWLDNAEQMIVEYREGSRRAKHRKAALRRWLDDDNVPHAMLYRPDGLYKFVGPKNSSTGPGTRWAPDQNAVDPWPLPNPVGVVPVVELPVNRRLKAGSFGWARGEYEHCEGLIDRINLLTFLGLVVAFWQGFPLRGIIGDKIAREVLKDDAGQPLLDEEGEKRMKSVPPFEPGADAVFQLENPNAKIAEFKAAERNNLAVYAELDQLATITKTPRHYFPLDGASSNPISADAIRASEGGQNAKVDEHKASLGEGWEEVLRLGGRMLEAPVELSPRAELKWADRESRSLAERADAATKLKDILPWQALAERVLGLTQDEISVLEQQRAGDPMSMLIAEARAASPVATAPTSSPPTPMPAGAASGNGNSGG